MNYKSLFSFIFFALFFLQCQQKVKQETEKNLPDTLSIQETYASSCLVPVEENSSLLLFDNDTRTSWKSMPGAGQGEGLVILLDSGVYIRALKIHPSTSDSLADISVIDIYLNGNFYAGQFSLNDTIRLNQKISKIAFYIRETSNAKQFSNNGEKSIPYDLKMYHPVKAVGIAEIEFFGKNNLKMICEKPKKAAFHENNKTYVTATKKAIAESPLENILDKTRISIQKDTASGKIYHKRIIIRSNKTLLLSSSVFYNDSLLSKKILKGKWKLIKKTKRQTQLTTSGNIAELTGRQKIIPVKNMEMIVMPTFVNAAKLGKFYTNLDAASFVNMEKLAENFALDIRYATTNNFTEHQLYDCPKCLLRWDVAKAIMKARNIFAEKGLTIKFFDCYRPLAVQKKMWEILPNRVYVANPYTSTGSMHNRGMAVDLTLLDSTGKELDMGTEFDFFGPKAFPHYTNLPDTVLANRKYLFTVMDSVGFRQSRSEWWHFSLREGKYHPISDKPLPCDAPAATEL